MQWLRQRLRVKVHVPETANATDDLHLCKLRMKLRVAARWPFFCYLLSQNLAVDEMDDDGLLPIHHAAKSGMVEVLKVFADDRGLTLNAVDKNGCTAAHHAAAAGHLCGT